MQTPVKGKYTYGYLFGVKTFYSDFHLGVDFVQPKGSPVIAPESGTIVYVGVGQQGGNTIHLRGKSGALTRYLHLDSFSVKQGQVVTEGQQLGTVGSTGQYSTGPHLHFDVWTTGKIDLKGRKGLVDPLIWLKNEMVTKENANGILYWLDGKEDHGKDSQALADALNKGDQEGKKILLKYVPSSEKLSRIRKILDE